MVARAFARALVSLAAMRRAQRGPLHPGWSIEEETMSRVLHHYARSSHHLPLAAQRWALHAMPRPPDRARIERVDAGGVPAAWIVPEGTLGDRVLVYLHGGGYSIGSIDTHRAFIARLAARLGARAFAVDYRLAPEHRFPAQRDDALAAWRWLLDRGVRPEQALLAGESAGGGLGLSTLVALREAGGPMPAAAALISPWLDLTLPRGSIDTNERFDYLPRRVLEVYVERVVGPGGAADPGLSPLLADLAGLPPLFVVAGGAEGIVDDATRLADRVRSAGGSIELRVHPGQLHAFPLFAPLPAARRAIEELVTFADVHLRTG